MGDAPPDGSPDEATPPASRIRVVFQDGRLIIADDLLYIGMIRLRSIEEPVDEVPGPNRRVAHRDRIA